MLKKVFYMMFTARPRGRSCVGEPICTCIIPFAIAPAGHTSAAGIIIFVGVEAERSEDISRIEGHEVPLVVSLWPDLVRVGLFLVHAPSGTMTWPSIPHVTVPYVAKL